MISTLLIKDLIHFQSKKSNLLPDSWLQSSRGHSKGNITFYAH